MGAGRTGAVVEVAADGMLVVVMIVAVFMAVIVVMLPLMHVLMDMRRAIGVRVRMGMGTGQPGGIMAVRMLVLMTVAVRMHRTVFMDVGVLVRPAFDLHFTCPAAANRTHPRLLYSISISLTRISVPPVGCTW